MTSYIIIGTLSYANEVRERLNSELNFLSGERFAFECDEQKDPPWSFFILRAQRGNKQGERKFAIRFAVAKAISDLFVNYMESAYVREYINRSYNYLSPHDREEVVNRALETMQKLRMVRRNRILQNLYDYLGDHQTLMVEGYARFRLKEYWGQLQRMVKRTVQEFVAAKDYLEFVRLLRCFIDLQEPKINEVHVFITTEGTFYLCDERGNVIRREHLRTPSFTVIDGEFNYKDYLLSMLITLSPKNIIFHVSDKIWNCNPIQTIQQVFCNRIARCPGCEKCRHLYMHNN
ncbi:MAG TPA: hypothetical protein GXX19_13395 [Syntrophomonadaceae bacterium]|nr:hypothetical protein [Syntrophomonadaceae bacterium]